MIVISGARSIMKSMVRFALLVLPVCLFVSSLSMAAEPTAGRIGLGDWPWWRGPSRDGVATGPDAPVTWSVNSNIAWKVPVNFFRR